ncbi:hypothetical protein ABEX08_29630 [Priestia megaterium]
MKMNWGLFTDGINEKIKYWVDVWSELVSDIEKGALGSSIITPHTLISDIQNEITFNQLNNKENRNYFIKKVQVIKSKDKVIRENYLSQFDLLLTNLEKENISYLKTITKNIKADFAKENYIQFVFAELEKHLLSSKDEESTYLTIRDLSLTLISELITYGNSLKRIKEMVAKTFSSYSIIGEGEKERVHLFFENHGLNYEDYPDARSFWENVKKVIDGLTVEERISSFKFYLTNKPEERSYIFPVVGLSRMRKSYIINDVEFYNPLHLSRTNMEISNLDREEMFDRGNEGGLVVNVLVKVTGVDEITDKEKAFEKAEACLDILRFMYQSEREIKIKKHKCIATNAESRIVYQAWGIDNETHKELFAKENPLDINDLIGNEDMLKLIKNVESIFLSNGDKVLKRTLMNSLSWYVKANRTERIEDKLLNYWISIENLMEFKAFNTNETVFLDKGSETKYALAKRLISHNSTLYYVLNLLGQVYNEVKTKVLSKNSIFQGIPENIYTECSFDVFNKPVDVISFLENLPELVKYTDRKVIIDKMNFAYNFYKDNKFARKQIIQKVNDVENDILYIYKYRNQIVHNGHVDQNILPHIVQNAKKYATNLINEIIYQCGETEKDLIDIMINIDYEYNVLIKNLEDKNKGFVDLLWPK